jgi:hypothetical protein
VNAFPAYLFPGKSGLTEPGGVSFRESAGSQRPEASLSRKERRGPGMDLARVSGAAR